MNRCADRQRLRTAHINFAKTFRSRYDIVHFVIERIETLTTGRHDREPGSADPNLQFIMAVGVESAMQSIIQLNIQRFRLLLQTESDAAKRETISRLLDEERKKLLPADPQAEPKLKR